MKKKTWQKKLPPSFNKIVRLYNKTAVRFFSIYGNDVDSKNNPVLKLFEGAAMPSLEKYYDNNADNLFDDASDLLNGQLQMKQLPELLNNHDTAGIEALIMETTESMDVESRAYFRRWIGNVPHEDNGKGFLELFSDMTSMQFHAALIPSSKIEPDNYNFENISPFIFSNLSMLCHVIYKMPLFALYEIAQKGDDESLFKLMTLDKTIFEHAWVRERIRKANFEGDRPFIENMANAIKKKLTINKVRIDLHLILMTFWLSGLYRLTMPELMDLLEDSGIKLDSDETTFRKFIDREITPYFNLNGLK